MRFSNLVKDIISERNEDGYVDDTAMGVDGRDARVAKRLHSVEQRHE